MTALSPLTGRLTRRGSTTAYLTSLKGIGPYAAAHCGLLLHDFRHIPVDTVAIADLRERYGQSPDEFTASRAGWGAYLALGYKLTRLRAKLALSHSQMARD